MLTQRLIAATNARDLEALVACFAPDYQLEMPVHPSRGFRGRDQVRRNWEQFFTAIPDLVCSLGRFTRDGDVEWGEWEMRGTRRDGAPHYLRGVIIFGTRSDQIVWARFYLEPVDVGTSTIDDAVQSMTGAA
jgi:ketosteroid isomerase-like protein